MTSEVPGPSKAEFEAQLGLPTPIPDFFSLTTGLRNAAIALKDCVVHLGTRAEVYRPNGSCVKLYPGTTKGKAKGTHADRIGQPKCGACKKPTAAEPCAHMLAWFCHVLGPTYFERGAATRPPTLGTQLTSQQESMFRNNVPHLLPEIAARMLAAIPNHVFENALGEDVVPGMPIRVIAYAQLVWIASKQSQDSALQQLRNEEHRDIVRRVFHHDIEPVRDRSSAVATASPPVSKQQLNQYQRHGAHRVNDYLHAMAGIVASDWEVSGGSDGTGLMLDSFGAYRDDRRHAQTKLTRLIKNWWQATDREGEFPSIDLEAEDKEAILADPEFGPLYTKLFKETKRRRHEFQMNVYSIGYRTNIVVAMSTRRNGIGEAALGLPHAMRTADVLNVHVLQYDRGYVNQDMALWAKRMNLHLYVQERITETRTSKGAGSKARADINAYFEANPHEAALHHGLRQNQESYMAAAKRIIGHGLRSRLYETVPGEALGRASVMNCWYLARLQVLVEAEAALYMHRVAQLGLDLVDPPRWKYWTHTSGHPDFAKAALTLEAGLYTPFTELEAKYGQPGKGGLDLLLRELQQQPGEPMSLSKALAEPIPA